MILTIRNDLISATTHSLSRYFSIIFPRAQDFHSENSQLHSVFAIEDDYPTSFTNRHPSLVCSNLTRILLESRVIEPRDRIVSVLSWSFRLSMFRYTVSSDLIACFPETVSISADQDLEVTSEYGQSSVYGKLQALLLTR